LIQGRFLFQLAVLKSAAGYCLNPFASGTFFILGHEQIHYGETRLNPFGSGTFFIQKTVEISTDLYESLNPFGSGTFFIRIFYV